MVNTSETFLIDANAIMTPYRLYYGFDIAPSFWQNVACAFKRKQIVLLDKVKDEVLNGDDELTKWIKDNENIIDVCHHKTKSIIDNYQSVLKYIHTCGFYKESALMEWAPTNIADPWLIAAVKSNNYTIVTLESPSGGLSKKTPNRSAKIPDVAKAFDVKYITLFDMMRQLGISL